MTQGEELTGMVLLAAPSGDYDRRLVLLTKERGKITVFARGARKPTSSFLAATSPFCFGKFNVFAGRTAYTLVNAEITNYFSELKEDYEGACYGFFFLEFASYYGRENLDAGDMLNLLYVSLKALVSGRIPRRLVQVVYETRLMVISGEYPQDTVEDPALSETARYALSFMIRTPLKSLYTFTLSGQVLDELVKEQNSIRKRYIDTRFKSLEILEIMTG